MSDLLSIGLSGLSIARTNLSVTGHNITNLNTPGYSRQEALQATRPAQFSGGGYIGSGATVVDIRRIYNDFLTSQVQISTSINSDAKAYQSQIDQLDRLLGGSTTGIGPGIEKMFAALQTAAEDPANIPARQLVLAEAEGLTSRFNTLHSQLETQNGFVNKQLGLVTDQVNRLAASVAGYNDAIAIAASSGRQPNDLIDARDEAIRQLNTYIGTTASVQDDNTINLFIGTGQPLVVGSQASSLEVVPGLRDPGRAEIQLVNASARQGVTDLITGGEIGGLLRFRGEVLDEAFNSVGRLALSISSEINSQLGQGLDLLGNAGNPLFRDINSAAFVDQRSLARIGNSDDSAQLGVTISDTSKLTTSDYALEFVDNAGNYALRRLSDNTFAGQYNINDVPPAVIDGFSVGAMAGSFAQGDRFLLTPTRNATASIGVTMRQPEQLALASPTTAQANLQNRGNAGISQPQVISWSNAPQVPLDMPALNGLLPVELTYDGAGGISAASGTLTPATLTPGQPNQLTWTDPGGAFTLQFTISGTPQGGDRFTLEYNADTNGTIGVSDNRNALNLIGLQNRASIGLQGGASGLNFVDAYGSLVQRVGTFTAQARMDVEASEAVLSQAVNNRDSVSAVNLDEEASNLIKFEQHYNASAQLIQVARSVFDTLINTFR